MFCFVRDCQTKTTHHCVHIARGAFRLSDYTKVQASFFVLFQNPGTIEGHCHFTCFEAISAQTILETELVYFIFIEQFVPVL